jgi:aminocarboxymuconate-semialdehyde decarboxylase
MGSRRQFLKNTAFSGLAFCSCGMLDYAAAQSRDLGGKDPGNDPTLNFNHPLAGTKRAPVMIDGKRVKVIDIHAHCFFQEAVALAGTGVYVNGAVKGGPQHYMSLSDGQVIKQRLDSMDAMGVDMQVLSINTFWYQKDRELATEICRINNDNLAKIVSAYPTRFNAFGCLAMQFPDLAVKQLEAIMKTPGMRGAAIQARVGDKEFSDPMFDPIWAKGQELGASFFIHPQSTPELGKRFKGNGWISNVIGNPLDTTIALQHIIYEGVLDKFPNLILISAHGGGFLGSYAPRMDHSCFVSPSNCDPSITLKKKPTEYLKQLYFDTLVFTPEALRHLANQVGTSQLMIGTDQPIPWSLDPVGHIMETPFTNRERVALLGGNASRVLNIKNI